MTSSLPVQVAMATGHKQSNGDMTVSSQPLAPMNTRTNVLQETTAGTWMAVGSLAENLGDFEKALALYDAALRHLPNNPEILTKLANVYRSKDVFFKAAELYEQALNFYPENGETWGLLGHCYLMLDDLQRAYAAYQRSLYYSENPNVPKLWHGIGILYDRYGSLEYAEEAFVRVLELDPNFEKSNEIYFRLGIIYKHQEKLQSALDCFQYILNNPPPPLTQPDVWFQIGSVLEQQKDLNGAREAYERVLQVNPQHAKVLQQLGCLYSQAEPASDGSAGTHSDKQLLQQDLNIALKYLLKSLEIDLSDAHSWYYLGRVHMIRGDFNAAYEAFQQAVNRDSRNPTFWCSIGVLYYQISQYRDALDAYTRAIRLNPYISEVWYDLGTLYETCNNQISDALDAYKQAERLDPGNPHIKARLEQLIKYQQEGNTQPPQLPANQQLRLPQAMILESTHMQSQALPHGQHPQAPLSQAPPNGQHSQLQVPHQQAPAPQQIPPGPIQPNRGQISPVPPHMQQLPTPHFSGPFNQQSNYHPSREPYQPPPRKTSVAGAPNANGSLTNNYELHLSAPQPGTHLESQLNSNSRTMSPLTRNPESAPVDVPPLGAKHDLDDKKDGKPLKKPSTKKGGKTQRRNSNSVVDEPSKQRNDLLTQDKVKEDEAKYGESDPVVSSHNGEREEKNKQEASKPYASNKEVPMQDTPKEATLKDDLDKQDAPKQGEASKHDTLLQGARQADTSKKDVSSQETSGVALAQRGGLHSTPERNNMESSTNSLKENRKPNEHQDNKMEPSEPPIRKVEEDENYDDD